MKKIIAILLVVISIQAKAQYWQEVNSGTQRQLLSIAFGSGQVGYIGGFDGYLLKTTNGGQTWAALPQISLMNSFNDVVDLDFVSANVGYAIISAYSNPIYRGELIKTTDGGLSWTSVDAGNIAGFCSHFFSEDNGFITGSAFFAGYVINKIPAGTPFQYHYFQPQPELFFKAIDFRNEQMGIVAGDKGFIARTFDGGLHWDTLTCQVTDTTINAIRFLNDSVLIAACEGQGGTMLLSFDTGRTWEVDFNSLTFDYPIIRSIVSSKKDSFIAVGASTTRSGQGMIYWHNGLQFTNYEIVKHSLRSVAMLNDSIAYAVGDSGIIVTNKIVNNVGIHNTVLDEHDFEVYPNPNNGTFTVASNIAHTITVLDITGKLIYGNDKPSNNHTISLQGMASGVYIVQMNVGDEKVVKRVTIGK